MSLRLVLDMNLPPRWAGEFAGEGIPADHWSHVGDIRAGDAEIMEWARRNQAIVLTNDLDFTTILALSNSVGPSVILLRARNLLIDSLRPRVSDALRIHEAAFRQGALIVIDESRATVRVLPLSSSPPN